MNKLFLRIWIFICCSARAWAHWFRQDSDDERSTMAIDPRFAWEIAGIFAEYDDELSQWETV